MGVGGESLPPGRGLSRVLAFLQIFFIFGSMGHFLFKFFYHGAMLFLLRFLICHKCNCNYNLMVTEKM